MKRSLPYLCIPFAALLLFAGSFFCGTRLSAAVNQPEPITCYAVLYPYEGYIGIYRSPDDYLTGASPQNIIRTPIESLPKADQSALQDGILLESAEKLRQLTEDLELRSLYFIR